MAELMGRFLSVLGLLLALGCAGLRPAEAYPAGFTATLSGGDCMGKVVVLDTQGAGGNGLYCLKGTRYSSLAAIPGYSFSRASAETCLWADGHLTTAASGVPCITDLGIGLWEQRTNSFLNSAIGVTQTLTTTAASWTLSFYGTGSIVMTGTCSGTRAGSGATVRVSLTVTATAGSCTLTVSGSTTNVQMEAGAFATPPITTTGAAATRAQDNFSITNATVAGQNVTVWGRLYYPVVPSGFSTQANQGVNKPGVRLSASGLDAFVNGVGDSANVGTPTAGFNKFVAAFSGTRAFGAIGGAKGATAFSWTDGSGTTLFIGQSQSNITLLNGYLTALAIAPVTLSDGQAQGLSQ